MHNIRKLTEDLVWVGANDRRIEKFEGVYGLGSGMSYSSYFGDFGKTVLMDTADKAEGPWTMSSSITWSPTTRLPS